MLPKPNPNQLPSGTNVYFLILIITSFMISFWSGQFLPGLEYFATPFDSQFQPGINFTRNGLYGVGICFVIFCYLFVYHTKRQRRAFGPTDVLSYQDPLWEKVHALSKEMSTEVKRLYLDRNIRNTDAVAFGFLKTRTILMGKGMLWLSKARPSDFTARIAHELGHFKNGDVKYAFFSRALVEANVCLMLMVLVWLCFQPARVVIMQYYLFTTPALGLPGASSELFFTLHGTRWLKFWLTRSLGSITITLPVFMFWALLLFLEYRSLLRTRELLADAQAARWAGEQALVAALGGDRNLQKPSIRERILQMFSAHPLISERIKVVTLPGDILNPNPLRFLFLGYIFSLATLMITNINVMISSLNSDYGRLIGSSDIPTIFRTVFGFENLLVSWLFVSVLLTFIAMHFIMVATLLRSSISRKINQQTTVQWLFPTLLQIAYIAAGTICGDFFHPYAQANQSALASSVLLGQPLHNIFVTSVGVYSVSSALQLSGILLATAVLLWIQTNLILKGSRSRPISSMEWGLLMLFTFWFVYQVFSVWWLPHTYPALGTASHYLYGAFMAALLLAAMGIVVYRIRGGVTVSQTSNGYPQWLLAS